MAIMSVKANVANKNILTGFLRKGYMTLTMWTISNKFNISTKDCLWIATTGNVVLMRQVEHKLDHELVIKVLHRAVKHGHIHVVGYLLPRVPMVPESVFRTCVHLKMPRIMKLLLEKYPWDYDRSLDPIIYYDSLECAMVLMELQLMSVTTSVVEKAICWHAHRIVKYAIEHRPSIMNRLIDWIVTTGYLEVVEMYLEENGVETLAKHTKELNYEVIMYILENDLPFCYGTLSELEHSTVDSIAEWASECLIASSIYG